MRSLFFITTAIDYVNSSPHLGHALEKVQADVIARYHRLLADKVWFLSGTDENSLKNVQAAKREKISINELVDRNASQFYNLKYALNLSYDDFIRTSQGRHKNGAQKLWRACQKDIYKKAYRGLYCVECEQFYKPAELINSLCPEHRIKPEPVEEENYFFRLSKYQGALKKLVESDKIKIIPITRKNEVLSFIKAGLEDICISRSQRRAQGWGIEVPGDPDQIQWVWFDALSNYINALGFAKNSRKFEQFWQKNKNKFHFIGKGIARFHALYWPAMLLSAKLALPKTIFVHGYLTVGGQKMSKSFGNVVDPFELVDKYGSDPVRYFLLREIPPSEDGDFTYAKFEGRYRFDLSQGLGNLVARILTLAKRAQLHRYSHISIQPQIKRTWKKYKAALNDFKFNQALKTIWDLISFCDGYIEKERPWEIDSQIKFQLPQKVEKRSLKGRVAVANLVFALGHIALMLRPFLPQTAEKIFNQLGIKAPAKKLSELPSLAFKIKKGPLLFPKFYSR